MSTYEQVRSIVANMTGGGVPVTNPTAEASLAAIETNSAFVASRPGFDVQLGNVGLGSVVLNGFCQFAANDPEQILAAGMDLTGEVLTFDRTRTGVLTSIASTSPTDMYDEGTPGSSMGMHTVFVSAIDANGDLFEVFQRLDGTTEQPITLDGTKTGTPASLIAVNSLLGLNAPFDPAPNNTLNAGALFAGPSSADWTTVAGVPDVKFMVMPAGGGISAAMFIYQRNGARLLFQDVILVGDNDTASTTFVNAYRNTAGLGQIDLNTLRAHVNGFIAFNVDAVPPLLPGDAMWFTVDSPGNLSHVVSAHFNCFEYQL